MRLIRVLRALLLVLCAATLSSPALAVDLTGQIVGQVLDDGGLEIPGVVITATSPKLQGVRTAQTPFDGRFRFVGLPPGPYVVTAEKPGFNTWTAEGVQVSIGETVTRFDRSIPRSRNGVNMGGLVSERSNPEVRT